MSDTLQSEETLASDTEPCQEADYPGSNGGTPAEFLPLVSKARLRKVYFLNLPDGVCVASRQVPSLTVTNRDRLKQWNSLPKAAQNGMCDIYKDVASYRAMLAEKKRLADEKAAAEKAKQAAEKTAAEEPKIETKIIPPEDGVVREFDPFEL